MNDDQRPAPDRGARLEDFAAELTGAVYPLVLRRGPKDWWINVELDLWRTLTRTVERWARRRPAAAPSNEFETWREGLLEDLTDSAASIAQESGIEGSLLELELGLDRAVRLVTGRGGRLCSLE